MNRAQARLYRDIEDGATDACSRDVIVEATLAATNPEECEEVDDPVMGPNPGLFEPVNEIKGQRKY